MEFRVECRAATGAIEVAATTSGRHFPLGYVAAATDEFGSTRTGILPANSSVTIDGLQPGSYELLLLNLSETARSLARPVRPCR